MYLLRINRALCVFVSLMIVSFTPQNSYASIGTTDLATLEIEAVGVIKNGHIVSTTPCHKSLANCLVTLTISPPSQGYVDIRNTSTTTSALDVQALLSTNYPDVSQIKCDAIAPGATCRLVLISGTEGHDPGGIPVAVSGRFVKNIVFFDLEQT